MQLRFSLSRGRYVERQDLVSTRQKPLCHRGTHVAEADQADHLFAHTYKYDTPILALAKSRIFLCNRTVRNPGTGSLVQARV